mgnify:CR=1 FL=1
MRLLALLLMVAFLFVPCARAQGTEPGDQTKRVTYFLLDISGSMKSRIADAESEIAEQRSRILNERPDAPLSLTEFRAERVEDCDNEIEVPAAVADANWPVRSRGRVFATNDYTPLGSALLAAIKKAGEGPADIFVASDWAQSPGCGASVEDALAAIDAQSDISITPIVIRANDSDLEFANSIARTSSIVMVTEEGHRFNTEKGAKRTGIIGGILSFIEAWLWFFGFLLLSGLSLHFGALNSQQAIHIDASAREIRSLQRAVLYDDNKRAGDELKKVLRGIERIRRKKDLLAELIKGPRRPKRSVSAKLKNWVWRMWMKLSLWLWPWQVLAGIAVCLSLFTLAAMPQNVVWGEFRLFEARKAAGRALDSDFATAFAVMWISTIFFAARQYQRRKEVEAEHALATDEAGWLAMSQERKIKIKAVDQYRDKRKIVEGFEFRSPLFVPDANAIEPSEISARLAFEGVASKAIELALRNRLDEQHASTNQLNDEAKRLEAYANLNSRSGVNFRQFVERMVSDTKIAGLPPVWKNLLGCWTTWADKKQCSLAIEEIQRHYTEG